MVVMPIFYQIMRRIEASDPVMLTFLFAIVGFWLWRNWHLPRWKCAPENTIPLLIGLLVIGFLLSFSHFADFRVGEGVEVYRTTRLSESIFHLGFVNTIKDNFPPPAIYAAGSVDFSHYHLNTHLQMEGIHRLTGIETDRLVFWYFPFLYFLLLFLLPYGFVKNHGGSQAAAIVAGILIFGSGLSFLPGVVGMADPTFAWVQFFYPTIFSVLTLNGLLPALVGLFVVLIALPAISEKQPVGFWLVLGLVIFGSYGLKSSMGVQIAGVLLAVSILKLALDRNNLRDWRLTAFSVILLSAMLIDLELLRSGTGNISVDFQPWFSLNSMLSRLGLENINEISRLAMFVLIFLLTLGVRLAGVLTLRHTLKLIPEIRWFVVFVLLFLVGGYVLPDIVYLGDDAHAFNHADWFAVQGLFASWFLVFLFLSRLDTTKLSGKAIIVLMIFFAFPSTLQLIWLKTDSPEVTIGPSEHEVVDFLKSTEPDSVVLHPLNQGKPSLASNFAGRSSVLNVHLSFVNETQGLTQRAIGTLTFFDPKTNPEIRTEIMNYYGVTHVLGPHSAEEWLNQQSDLKKEFSNEKYSVWAVYY
jgi:hypothetical protein